MLRIPSLLASVGIALLLTAVGCGSGRRSGPDGAPSDGPADGAGIDRFDSGAAGDARDKDVGLNEDAGRDADAAPDADAGGDVLPSGAGVCSADASVCVPPAGTPLYLQPPSASGTGELFHQPMIGGQGHLGNYTDLYDGYSVVITWPGQAAALAHSPNTIAAWGGIDLDNNVFIQNGYFADPSPCHGGDFAQIYQLGGVSSALVWGVGGAGAYCAPGQSAQFRAERTGTVWVFSMRVVGGGDFVEQGRYDFGVVAHATLPVLALMEMYDFDESVEKTEPITFGPVLLKTVDGVWKPIDEMSTANHPDGQSPRLKIRPEPALAGVTVGRAGPMCNGPNLELWGSDAPTSPSRVHLPCWAADVHCDATTSACAP